MRSIKTRVPLRICLAGGGTDLPAYYMKFGGLVVSGAIDKYIDIELNETTDLSHKYELDINWCKEYVDDIDHITNGIVREVLRRYVDKLKYPIQLIVRSDVSGGTGLGSSGALTVGLLHAFERLIIRQPSLSYLAESAFDIERFYLKQPVGKQDQYMAAFGGVACLDIDTRGKVDVSDIPGLSITELQSRLYLFNTGVRRHASQILAKQDNKDNVNNIRQLQYIHMLAIKSLQCLETGNFDTFGQLMHKHWTKKKAIDPAMTTPKIDAAYEAAIASGALGGKIVGAGGGGFLLIYTTKPKELFDAMSGHGFEYTPFQFVENGVS